MKKSFSEFIEDRKPKFESEVKEKVEQLRKILLVNTMVPPRLDMEEAQKVALIRESDEFVILCSLDTTLEFCKENNE